MNMSCALRWTLLSEAQPTLGMYVVLFVHRLLFELSLTVIGHNLLYLRQSLD